MIKRLSTLAILTVLAAPAWAGGLGIGASFWSTDEADDGSGVGGRLAVDLGENLDLDVHVSFLEELFIDPPTTPPFDLEMTPIDVGLSWGFDTRSRVTPRVGGGLTDVMIEVLGSDVDTEVGDGVRSLRRVPELELGGGEHRRDVHLVASAPREPEGEGGGPIRSA